MSTCSQSRSEKAPAGPAVPEGRPDRVRKPFRVLAWILPVIALSAACGKPVEETPPYRPDVMFILVDALRMDRLGVNGYPKPTTPRIDELATEGVTFTHAFCQSPISLAAIMFSISGATALGTHTI